MDSPQRRLSPRLLERSWRVPARQGDSEDGAATDAVVIGGHGGAGSRAALATITAFAARDWVEQAGCGAWRITEAGRAHHHRLSAGDDPFRAQHQLHQERQLATPEGALRTVRANAHESPLDWLRGRKDRTGERFLTEEQYQAGERLRRDFTMASISASVTLDWDRLNRPRARQRGHSQGPGQGDPAETAIAAHQRFGAALAAVGPEMSGLVVDVCCLLVGLDEVERARQWPRRSAKIVLRLALGQLARHYGLIRPEAERRAGRSRHWGREGFRPALDGGEDTDAA